MKKENQQYIFSAHNAMIPTLHIYNWQNLYPESSCCWYQLNEKLNQTLIISQFPGSII